MNTIQIALTAVTLGLLSLAALVLWLGLTRLRAEQTRGRHAAEDAASGSKLALEETRRMAADLGRMVTRGLVLVPEGAVKIYRPPVRVAIVQPSLTMDEIAASAGRPVPIEEETPIPVSVERRRGRLLLLDREDETEDDADPTEVMGAAIGVMGSRRGA